MNAPVAVPPGPAHAVYAPSSAHRWTLCTASAEAIAQLGEQDEGDAAAEGTAAHDEIERCLGHSEKTRRTLQKPEPLPVNPDHPAAYGVALVLDYVAKLPAGHLWIEQRVTLTEQIWGRCDVAHWHAESETLTIIDYKNGYVDVQAEENEQLQIYAAASIYTHNLPAKWIRLVVVQPNSIMPVPRVKQWVTDAAKLHAFASRAAAVPGGPKEFAAGEQCKYCPLFGRCPASQDILARLSVALVNAPDAVPADQVALFMAMKKPVEDWFKSLDKAWTKKALAGEVPPGMKVIQTTKHRAWKDDVQAREYIAAQKGVAALEPPTPAQAEKMGIDHAWVDANSTRPDGGPALAFESDKRPTFEVKSAAKMFGGIVSGQ